MRVRPEVLSIEKQPGMQSTKAEDAIGGLQRTYGLLKLDSDAMNCKCLASMSQQQLAASCSRVQVVQSATASRPSNVHVNLAAICP